MRKSSVGLSISPSSMSGFLTGLREAEARVVMVAQEGMNNAAQQFYDQTQTSVPKVTGALSSSGKVSSQNSGAVLERTIGYGGSNVNPRTRRPTSSYALQVHEIYNGAHPNSYKWLERTLYDFGNETFLRSLAASIGSVL